MHNFVNLSTVAALLLHMWLGCCVHHVHAADGTGDDEHAVEHIAHEHSCQGYHGLDHSGEKAPNPADTPAKHCSDNQCVFTAARADVLQQSFFALVVGFITDSTVGSIGSSTLSVDSGGGSLVPPVRLHLFNQVLLI